MFIIQNLLVKMKIIKISRRKKIYRAILIIALLYLLYFFGIFTNIYETTLKTLPNKIELEYDYNDHSRNQEYKYIHTAPNTCEKAPFLLILIKSKVDNFKERLAVRKTWAQLDEYGIIKRVFLLGRPKPFHDKIAHKLNEEITIYGDIVQQDFYDGYFNNTLQTLMGIKWSIDYCLNASFYLFSDDDNFVNPRLLLSYLKHNVSKEEYDRFYGGWVYESSSPRRSRTSKWYISVNEYPYRKYPPFVAGNFVLFSPSCLNLFQMFVNKVRLFRFDDVYLGMIAYYLDIKPIHVSNALYFKQAYDPNDFANKMIAVHRYSGNRLLRVWNDIGEFVKFEPISYEQYDNGVFFPIDS